MTKRSYLAIRKFVSLYPSGDVLDIGCGDGEQTAFLRNSGLNVTSIDPIGGDVTGLWPDVILNRTFGAIWCSHVLEHSRNVGMFLDACFAHLLDNGILAVTVPPMKTNIVGGHLTLWNAGLLLYNLIMAGFDCRKAMVKTYGYNVSVIVRKVAAILPDLRYDAGDIEELSRYFPVPVHQGFDGNIVECNW